MKLSEPLVAGKLEKRYQRFLADIRLVSGEVVTVHCANSGRMTGLLAPGSPVMLSISANPKRKLQYTWELVKVNNNWVAVNTLLANRMVREALQNQEIVELASYQTVKPESAWKEKTRFDFLLQNKNKRCYVEVKSVTLAAGDLALFPDAVTERGTKHLRELINVVEAGHRAVIFYLINRGDCNRFAPAAEIDPLYAQTLLEASGKGVETLVYQAKIEPPFLRISGKIDID